MVTKNLNKLLIQTEDDSGESLQDFSIATDNPNFDKVEVVFKNLEQRLIDLIAANKNGAIFGCVAWLTSKPLLKALSNCDTVQILVQKEDFLRPDLDTKDLTVWKNDLQKLYGLLKCKRDRFNFLEPIKSLSYLSSPEVQAIRCVGNNNADKHSAFPRSHHKFLVFCNFDKNGNYLPISVWTGSFNLTYNATQSFENAIIFSDKSGKNEIINSYLKEHHQIFALSEQLNWDSDWTSPEFRIGT